MKQGQVTLAQAKRFLAERYNQLASELEPLHGGEWSSAFGFSCDGQEFVARFGRYREDYEADLAAVAYNSPELPVPTVYEIGEAFDGVYAISERRRGIPLETLPTNAWEKALPLLWTALDRLRSLEATGLGDDWRELLLNLLEDQPGARVSGWSTKLARQGELSELFRNGMPLLERLLPQCPREAHIVHNDLLHGNVLVAPDGSELRAVFDWGTSLQVDFLYEIAALSFFGPWFANMAPLDLEKEASTHYQEIGLEVPDFERRVCTYMVHIGLLHVAYGLFAERPADETYWVAERTHEVLGRLS